MAVQVIDGNQRQLLREGEALRGGETDEERADQARALGHTDRIEALELRVSLGQRLPHHREDELEVTSRGDLRDDAAEAGVQLGLGRDDVGTNVAVGGHNRRRRLVARGLERQDHGMAETMFPP